MRYFCPCPIECECLYTYPLSPTNCFNQWNVSHTQNPIENAVICAVISTFFCGFNFCFDSMRWRWLVSCFFRRICQIRLNRRKKTVFQFSDEKFSAHSLLGVGAIFRLKYIYIYYIYIFNQSFSAYTNQKAHSFEIV